MTTMRRYNNVLLKVRHTRKMGPSDDVILTLLNVISSEYLLMYCPVICRECEYSVNVKLYTCNQECDAAYFVTREQFG